MNISPLLLGLAFTPDVPAIESASAAVGEDRLVVEVRTSEPIAAQDLRTKVTGTSLVFYLENTRIAGGKQVLGDAHLPVNVYPRMAYTKLEAPWPAEWLCSGPVSTTVLDHGARATLGCQRRAGAGSAAPPATGEARPAIASAKPMESANPTVAAKAAAPAKSPSAPEIKATATPAAEAEAAARPAEAVSESTAAAEPGKPAAGAAAVAASVEPAAAGAPTPPAESIDLRDARSSSATPPWAILSGLLLVAIAGTFVWRRKRQQQSSLIRILETASLGPKRALIVAEINGERLILGSSEAGISVITGPAEGETAPRTPVAVLRQADALEAPPAVLPEESEGGLLARLFKRRRDADLVEGDDPPSTMAEDFRDLLQDSLEDEELRQRLAAGMGGRTS